MIAVLLLCIQLHKAVVSHTAHLIKKIPKYYLNVLIINVFEL